MSFSKIRWGALALAGLLGVSLAALPSEAEAKKHHSHKKSHVVHKKHKGKRGSAKASSVLPVRTLQRNLADLGYYTGKVDGKNGPRTKNALMAFQRDQGLPPHGVADAATVQALTRAIEDLRGIGYRRQGGNLPDALPPVIQEPAKLSSRYGAFTVQEDSTGAGTRSYTVMLNGQTILTAPNQTAPLRLSSTYEIGGEDVILLSVYTGTNSCFYENSVLSIRPDASTVRQVIPVCVEGGQAHVQDGSLYIQFPNGYDGATPGATWRYENGKLDQLL